MTAIVGTVPAEPADGGDEGPAPAGSLLAASNLADLTGVAAARSNLGLGTMATQAASAVAITGGTINTIPTTNLKVIKFVATSVNLVGGTTATIIPAQAQKFRATRIDIHVKTVTGFIAVASISIGSNSASFNNLMAIAALGTASVVDALVAPASLVILDVAVDLTTSGLVVKLTTPATATTMTADIHVVGYFTEP